MLIRNGEVRGDMLRHPMFFLRRHLFQPLVQNRTTPLAAAKDVQWATNTMQDSLHGRRGKNSNTWLCVQEIDVGNVCHILV